MYCDIHEKTHHYGSGPYNECSRKLRVIEKRARNSERSKVEKELKMKYSTRIAKLELELKLLEQHNTELGKEKKEKEKIVEELAKKPSVSYSNCDFRSVNIADLSGRCKRMITNVVQELKSKNLSVPEIRGEVEKRIDSAVKNNLLSTEEKKENLLDLLNGELQDGLRDHFHSEILAVPELG